MFSRFERLVEPFPEDFPGRPPTSLYQFCRHFSRGAEGPLIAMAILVTLVSIAEVALFGVMGALVDWLAAHSPATFWQAEGDKLLLIALLIVFVLPVFAIGHALVTRQALMGNFPMVVRWQAHRYLLSQSLAFFQNEFAGRISTKLMQTALAVRETVMKLLDIFVYVAVYFTSVLVLLASADWRLALPFLGWMIAYALLLRFLLPRLMDISERQADARAVMTGRIVDSYTNIATVKLFSHAQRESAYARDGMRGFLHTVYPQMRLVTLLDAGVWSLNMLLLLVTTSLSIWLWMQDALTGGAIAVAISLSLRLDGMSHWIMWEVAALFENLGTVRDGINTMSNPIQVLDAPDAKPLRPERGEIVFEEVGFDYGEGQPVFDKLSLAIRPGEKVGLVGRSGAGKSTLVNLLLRFYDLNSGRICIDGQDIATVTQESLRASIGVVSQDTSLLHRSIRENIAYGRQDATEEQLRAAARRAQALEFIEALGDQDGRSGFDALVGERGVKLSGGQRQRVAIARVMLKDAPILILDEATSALDSEVEAAIQESLNELMQGKTVIAIAHRLSTIAAMDRLLVLDGGRIVESGTHSELVDSGGIYSLLWKHQSGGFIGTD